MNWDWPKFVPAWLPSRTYESAGDDSVTELEGGGGGGGGGGVVESYRRRSTFTRAATSPPENWSKSSPATILWSLWKSPKAPRLPPVMPSPPPNVSSIVPSRS